MEQVPVQRNSGFMRRFGSNILLYVVTLVIIMVFIYFIYQFVYGSGVLKTNLLVTNKVYAKDVGVGKMDVKIPNIYDGGEFTINFWIYVNDYKYRNNQRKHLVEIGHMSTKSTPTNFSTILIGLGGSTPTLLVRTHTMPSDSYAANVGNHKFGITDCSGGNDDCSGGEHFGFQSLTDVNMAVNTKDNSLYVTDKNKFFRAFAPGSIDENTLLNSKGSTCDVKELPMQKWINVCTVMNGKTLDIYLDGKLVKTCIYRNFYKVDQAGEGPVLHYLQGGGTNQGFDGYFSRLQVFNTSLTPDDIYKNYMAGPSGSSPTNDPVAFLKYIFTG